MLIVSLIIATLLFFPLIIFFDYHKKHNFHKALWFVIIYVLAFTAISLLLKAMGLKLVYYLLLIPITIFGVLFLKNNRNKS